MSKSSDYCSRTSGLGTHLRRFEGMKRVANIDFFIAVFLLSGAEGTNKMFREIKMVENHWPNA